MRQDYKKKTRTLGVLSSPRYTIIPPPPPAKLTL